MDMEKGYNANVIASSFREQLKRKILHIVSNFISNKTLLVAWTKRAADPTLPVFALLLLPEVSNSNYETIDDQMD